MIAFAITKPKSVFVFAGGGSIGAAQVGMLRALLESGIGADLVSASCFSVEQQPRDRFVPRRSEANRPSRDAS
jgi:hypothetical protein